MDHKGQWLALLALTVGTSAGLSALELPAALLLGPIIAAIALALRAKAPILVAEVVIEQVANESKEASVVAFSTDDADKWTELLEKYDPNDTKYQM